MQVSFRLFPDISPIFAKKSTIIDPQATILVTGGTGFIGAYIIEELLQQGFKVRALKRKTASLPAFITSEKWQDLEWVEGDILDVGSLEDAMQGIDTVIHCAAIVSFRKKDRHRMYQINVEGTRNVVNIALETGLRRIIYISSVAAIGRKLQNGIVDENAKWEDNQAHTHYAISKHKAELEVWRGFSEGLNGFILNPATVLGYGDWNKGSCGLFRNAYKEFKWYTTGVNGFADVSDLARATVVLMQTDITEERFIVCNDNWPFRKIFDTMADAFGKKRPGREAGPLLSAIAWRMEKFKSFFNGKAPLLTRESAKVAQSHTRFDNTKILKTLPGFEFRPLEASIHEACNRYQSAYEGPTE
ncbi:NAD-dependent epimerase/dehydratase family protein [Niabella terrae]